MLLQFCDVRFRQIYGKRKEIAELKKEKKSDTHIKIQKPNLYTNV